MKALYSVGGRVPVARVLREHRAALLPVAVVLALNLVAWLALVVPLSQRAAGEERRAQNAERARADAEADFKKAEALRISTHRATEDLATFYRDVLPSSVATARRILSLRLRQLADAHGVEFQGSGTTEEQLRESSLLRLVMSMELAGSYDDIRAFIHELETSSEFVVIDQVRLAEATGQATGLQLTLDVSTYYRAAQPAMQVGNDGR